MNDGARLSWLDQLRLRLRRLGLPAPIGKDPVDKDPAGGDLGDPKGPRPAGEDADALSAGILRAQVEVIRRAFEDRGGIVVAPRRGTRPPRDDADAHFLYRPRHAIVRGDRLGETRRVLEERDDYEESLRVDRELTENALLVTLPRRVRTVDAEEDLLYTLDFVNAGERAGSAGPDHVFYLTARAQMCPATEPEMLGRHQHTFPTVSKDAGAGKGVRVGVVDSGLWVPAVTSPTTPWMHDVHADPSDVEHVDPAHLHPYAGHGTFVSGVVRCFAPAARVEVEGVLTHGGAVYESAIVDQLDEALRDDDHPQLISISAGTHTWNSLAPLGFAMLAAAHGLDDGEETLIVAAAGNDASDEPFWPAAFPWVVGVGSVDPDGGVSDFSNVGSWVDVYARGRNLVNAFPIGDYTCYEPPNVGTVRTFAGLARWSGTSFATPVVTGLIAARMSASGDNARQAWSAVRASATSSVDPRGGTIATVGPLG